MDITHLGDLLVKVDNYISANSLTLTFIGVLAGIIIFLIFLFYMHKINKIIMTQNRQLIEYFNQIRRNSNIDRAMTCINEFNSTDFRIKVLSVLEINHNMLEKNSGEYQNIVNDAEFRHALINCMHFFDNTGYLYIHDFMEKSLIISNLSIVSLEWFDRLEPFFDSDKDNIRYWKDVNELFRSTKVLNLDEEINPIGEKALF